PSTYTLSLHDALPISSAPTSHRLTGPTESNTQLRCGPVESSRRGMGGRGYDSPDGSRLRICARSAAILARRLMMRARPGAVLARSEEHTSELQSRGHL